MSEDAKGLNRVPASTAGGDPLRRRSATTRGRRLKRFGLVFGLVGVTTLAAAYAGSGLVAPTPDAPVKTADGGTSADKSAGAGKADPKVAALQAERERAADEVARLEARRLEDDARKAVVQRELEELERRRDALKSEVAELAAPLSAAPGEEEPDQVGDAAPEPAAGPRPDVAEAPAEADDAPEIRRTPPSPVANRAERARDEPAGSTAAVDENLGVATDARVRVFIHVRATDARAIARARAVAAELEREGVAVAGIRGVPFPVRQDAMRYFYDADRGSLGALSRAVEGAVGVAPRAQDFRRYGAPPRRGTLELWLS